MTTSPAWHIAAISPAPRREPRRLVGPFLAAAFCLAVWLFILALIAPAIVPAFAHVIELGDPDAYGGAGYDARMAGAYPSGFDGVGAMVRRAGAYGD